MDKRNIFYITACLLLVYFLFPLHTNETSVIIPNVQTHYRQAITEACPSVTVLDCKPFSGLRLFRDGQNIALHETEASPLANIHQGYTFSPHYVQTVVIVIDRDQTAESILGWEDILKSSLPVSFAFGNEAGLMVWNTPSNYHIVTSMANALYDAYDIKNIAKDFKKLYSENRFFTNDDTKPISVMYDSEAVNLLQQDRNIEIVFPTEGTQSFIIGLLHNDTLDINSASLDAALIENGLRLVDGTANSYYPDSAAYKNARTDIDYKKYNTAIANIDSIMRRDSFGIRLYGLANNKERTTGYIICITVVIMYLISVIVRVTQKNIRNTIVLICSLELLLATTQYTKALVNNNPMLETFLWYAFYFSFVLIPTFFVYVAVITGKTPEKNKISITYKLYFITSCLFILFVSTNNIHNQVFVIYDYYHTYFDYNWGYYAVMSWIYGSITIALGLLIVKSFQNPRKWAYILPILSSILTLLYTIGVVLRIPIARDFEVGYGTAIALLLFCEACIQSRLFPINKGYKKLFLNSSLEMEIYETADFPILQSSSIAKITENHILRTSPVSGGSFYYYEDHTSLNEIKKKLDGSIVQLEKNSIALQKKGEIEANLAALMVQKQVYEHIDSFLQEDTKKISLLLESLKNSKMSHRTVSKINIIACGIKRECILRINTLSKKSHDIYDFFNYIHEMDEFAKTIPLKITIDTNSKGSISSSQALLMYKMFRFVIESAIDSLCDDIVVQLYEKNNVTVFSLITNKDIAHQVHFSSLQEQANLLDGDFQIKPWDDTTAILLSFKKGSNTR